MSDQISRVIVLDGSRLPRRWPAKAPAEALEFAIDWTLRLPPGDEIAASAFELPPGSLVASRATHTGTQTTVWLAGGEAGRIYDIVNRIKPLNGRELDQVVRLKIKQI